MSRFILIVVLSLLVDVDHLYDYFIWSDGNIKISDFWGTQYFIENNRAYVLFHAWEWTIILGLLSIWRGWKSIFTILFFALVAQLIVDSITVKSFSFYFLTYRINTNFALP